jgi:transcription initiation factor TFIIIB Brf1 subunit/transcription initiation factor TFIIB
MGYIDDRSDWNNYDMARGDQSRVGDQSSQLLLTSDSNRICRAAFVSSNVSKPRKNAEEAFREVSAIARTAFPGISEGIFNAAGAWFHKYVKKTNARKLEHAMVACLYAASAYCNLAKMADVFDMAKEDIEKALTRVQSALPDERALCDSRKIHNVVLEMINSWHAFSKPELHSIKSKVLELCDMIRGSIEHDAEYHNLGAALICLACDMLMLKVKRKDLCAQLRCKPQTITNNYNAVIATLRKLAQKADQ